jgi:hypothetical protein
MVWTRSCAYESNVEERHAVDWFSKLEELSKLQGSGHKETVDNARRPRM